VKCPSSEFSETFIQLMRNRMAMSYAKYGAIADAYPEKVDAIQSCIERIEKYIETGNKEWLIDGANFLMIEFIVPRHKRAHFRATDSQESPGRFIIDDSKDKHASNKDL
jgi:hypothetical protein